MRQFRSLVSDPFSPVLLWSLLGAVLVGLSDPPEALAQVRIGERLYPDLLWGEGEEDPNDFPDGGMILHPEDFVIATGKLWKGAPPPQIGSFLFQGKEIQNSGKFNNKAVALLLTGKKEERFLAGEMLREGIKFDPRFFPFRYNLGRFYQIEKNYEEAIRQFEFAKAEIPEYYRTYIHLGRLSEITGEVYYAIQCYKNASQKNPYDTQSLVLLAEHYMDTGLPNRAKLYLEKALKIEEGSPDARLGLARLEYNAGNFFRAYSIFRKTELFTPEGKKKRYDKKFHFYFAETASRVQDYETAENQYSEIMKYPNDPFFTTFSYKVVERRRNIARRFSEIKRTSQETQTETDS